MMVLGKMGVMRGLMGEMEVEVMEKMEKVMGGMQMGATKEVEGTEERAAAE